LYRQQIAVNFEIRNGKKASHLSTINVFDDLFNGWILILLLG
jgi:hypothetical protein